MVWRILASCLLVCFHTAALAHIRTDPNTFTTSSTWNGGDLNHSFELCVTSVQGNSPNGTTPADYAIQAQGPFSLESNTDTIAVNLAWEDVITGNRVNLQPNTATAEVFTGAARHCPGGNNARLILAASATAIEAVPPGTYSRQFTFTASNSGGGRSTADFTVTVELTVPNSIQVSQIDDIALGQFDGNNDITRSDNLCVYLANGGSYAVTLTGSGAGGAFTLSNGTSIIPYAVSWDDGQGAQTATAGTALTSRANSYTGAPDCNGGANNNATVIIEVLATDMGAASSAGEHTDVLTIMVEME